METNRLKWLMTNADLSYRKITRLTGIDTGSLRKLCQGERKVSTKYVERLSHLFNCTTDFLLELSEVGIICNYKDGSAVLSIKDYIEIDNKTPIQVMIIDKQVHRFINQSVVSESIVEPKVSFPKIAKAVDSYFDNDYQRQLMAMLKEMQLQALISGGDFQNQRDILEYAKYIYVKTFNKDFNKDECPEYLNVDKGKIPSELDKQKQPNEYLEIVDDIIALDPNSKQTVLSVIEAMKNKGG